MTMKHTKQSIISKDGVSYLIPFILITSCFALWGFALPVVSSWDSIRTVIVNVTVRTVKRKSQPFYEQV